MEMKISSRFSLAVCLCLLSLSVFAQSDEDEEGEYTRKGADTCLGCHDDQESLALFKTPHAVPSDAHGPFGPGQLQCEACHGPGGKHAARVRRGQERPPAIRFGTGTETAIEVQNGICQGCHNAATGFAWHGSEHDINEISCADCHQLHVARDPVQQVATQPEVCFACHRQQHSQSLKPYAHPFDEGKMDCSGCHNPHGNRTEFLFARQTLNDTCFECHAEKRGPYLWEHAPVAEDCSLCHDPHGSNNPGMLSMRGPMLCQSCHAQPEHQSFANGPDGLPDGNASRYLLGRNCMNCHTQVHGSNHPSGSRLMR